MTPAKNPAAVVLSRAAKRAKRHASALGKLARGKPKRYSEAERERLRKRLAVLRERRWPVKSSK